MWWTKMFSSVENRCKSCLLLLVLVGQIPSGIIPIHTQLPRTISSTRAVLKYVAAVLGRPLLVGDVFSTGLWLSTPLCNMLNLYLLLVNVSRGDMFRLQKLNNKQTSSREVFQTSRYYMFASNKRCRCRVAEILHSCQPHVLELPHKTNFS